MKSTGIVRRIDELGRVVLPKELRKTFGINEHDPLEIFVESERIILQKHVRGCTFCGSDEDLTFVHGKEVCGKCIGEIAQFHGIVK